MKKAPLLLILILCATASASAQNQSQYVAYDYEAVTVDNTIDQFSAAKIQPAGKSYRAELVIFRVVCAATSPCDINITYDGVTTVSTTVGFPIKESEAVEVYTNTNIKNFRAIRSGANNAILRAVYFRKQ